MAMLYVRGARRPRRTCVVAQRLRWRGVSRGRADHRRRTHPAERRTAASIMSVRDRVREPGRAGRGVIEELDVCRRGRRWWLRRRVALSQVSGVSVARESVLAFVFTESSQVSRMSRWLPYEKIGSPCVRVRTIVKKQARWRPASACQVESAAVTTTTTGAATTSAMARSWFRGRVLAINHALYGSCT
ncbi:uncharacterized protein LOC123413113 [Hordeum vulgare subsp. vulgare]|uniref:uncharacterized protein LOC123413113 n=1 Tax=Hordeum vulgare subsp. vulgare TaxID=112509 RepID=UPI001D1A4517|nr:uncharacterized protein LOC123413113 [Hordeum vulgare subsp. vulgare]